eukprot:675763-Prymnesium_polylepis.1
MQRWAHREEAARPVPSARCGVKKARCVYNSKHKGNTKAGAGEPVTSVTARTAMSHAKFQGAQ